jgi:hypothetical protein
MSRTRQEATVAWAEMRPLRRAGFTLMPLTGRRTPWHGWREEHYSEVDFIAHLMRGGAVGVRLGQRDLVIDVDPRNGGDASFDRLCFDIGVNLDADNVPAVRSGGGGRHLYYRKPGVRTRVNIPAVYPGIDFKRLGGYIVAPGSHHPSGGTYRWLRPLGAAPEAPDALIALLRDPSSGHRASGADERLAGAIRIDGAEPVKNLDALRVPDHTKALIAVDAAPGQRSERVRSVILSMIACGESNETILGVLTDPRWAISESVLEKDDPDGYARRQIVRAHAWLHAQRRGEFDDDV